MNKDELEKILDKISAEKEETKLSAKLAIFVLLTFIPMSLFSAWVLTKLWFWFVVPFGVVGLSMPHAYGISCLVHYFRISTNNGAKINSKEALTRTVGLYSKPFMLLFIGWLCTLFMG